MNLVTARSYPRMAHPSTNSHAQKQLHTQFKGNHSSPPPNQPQKPEWLKRIAIVGALMGGSLTTYGVVNNHYASNNPPPAPQVQTDRAPLNNVQDKPDSQNKPAGQNSSVVPGRIIQDNRTMDAEFKGSRTLSLVTCSSDGEGVEGDFYIIWEKDLLTTNLEDREAQLKMILSKLPEEKILPQWKEPGVYLVAGQKPEGVITYANDIMEAYQNHLIHTVIQPELSVRFNDMFGSKTRSAIASNLQNLLFNFEYSQGTSAPTTLKGFMNNQGLTPTSIGFSKMKVGAHQFEIEKVVTTQMEIKPTFFDQDKTNPTTGETQGQPTLADPINEPPPPPEPNTDPLPPPEPIPDPIPNLPQST